MMEQISVLEGRKEGRKERRKEGKKEKSEVVSLYLAYIRFSCRKCNNRSGTAILV